MSTITEKKDDVKSQKNTQEEIIKENINVQIDRSRIEKELNDELQQKEAARQRLEDEKKKLNDELLKHQKMIEEMQEKEKNKTEEFEQLIKERDETKKQLQDIAIAEFNKVKAAELEKLKNAGLDENKVKEFDEKIQRPKDLEEMQWMLKFLGDNLAKVNKDETEKPLTTIPPNPQNPPKFSTVQKIQEKKGENKWEYETPKAAVDDLYQKSLQGDKEAIAMLERLWGKFLPTLKKQRTTFGITQCPVCGMGILENEKCPLCGFDPVLWKAKGGEIF